MKKKVTVAPDDLGGLMKVTKLPQDAIRSDSSIFIKDVTMGKFLVQALRFWAESVPLVEIG